MTDIVFQPVRGTENAIKRRPIVDGNVYFAYDSGKIYLDKDGARYLMGNTGSGIIYSHGTEETIIKEFPDDETSFTYLIPDSDLDNSTVTPKADGLILNSDGRFFRIVNYSNHTITAILLAVSGTGGGSGGGGGSIVTYSDRAKLNKIDPESNYLINGKEASIQVSAISGKDFDGSILDTKLTVYWTLSERTSTGVLSQYAQGTFPIDASTDEEAIWETFEYGTKARQSTTNVLTMYVKGIYSTASREFSYEFYTSNLELLTHANFNNINAYSPSSVDIYCSAIGDLEKIIFYYFEVNGEMEPLNPNGTVLPSGINEPTFHVPDALATHGAHRVRIELYQYINGKADFTSAATPIEMEIGVVDREETKPVIWLGEYNNEYYQYDSIKIPFRAYDPAATLSTMVTLFKDSNKIGTREITDSKNFSIWEIVDADLNAQNYYTISCGQEENEVRKEITFLVSEDPNRQGMKTVTSGLRYSFNASGRSNNESAASKIRCSYTNNKNETINAEFEHFNWYNNGWVVDDNGNACLRISNGAQFTIPLGKTIFAGDKNDIKSNTFEFQFKVRNVQDYSQIIHNVTRYKSNSEPTHGRTYGSWTDDFSYNGDPSVYQAFTNKTYLEWSNGKVYDNYDAFLQWYIPRYVSEYPELCDNPDQQIFPVSYDDLEFRQVDKILNTDYAACKYYVGGRGICIGAQDALFTNGTDTVNVAYVEDKIINLTIVYSEAEDGSNKLMFIYLNGMLTGVSKSSIAGDWSIGDTDDTNIVFNSQYCDFDLYKIRVYNHGLTLSEIITNYMVDIKDPIGYDLSNLAPFNTTLGESQFSFSAMERYNEAHPDGYIMPYIIFTTNPTSGNKLPYSKQVPIPDVTVEFVNTGLERAYVTGELNELAERAGQTVEEYYKHHCPSWKGENVAMSVQGTSSEFYPRRNYKAKTKNYDDPYNTESSKTVHMFMNRGPYAQQYVDDKNSTHLDWFYMDNDTVGTTKFTLKIDYMESSGTYNMGFANLVKNAYTNHPYYDYIKAGAFQKADTDYAVVDLSTATYNDSTTYWYKNHKGNWKNTTEDELNVIHDEADPAAAWAMGPYEYGRSKNISKVNSGDNNWYTAVTVYNTISLSDIKTNDLRTSVQGFPVLAFHQQTDDTGKAIGSPLFIGRYNMLLDKGSDEMYGFKMDNVYQKFVQSKGKPTKISKVAECWEGENNSRGFCSFRDAAISREEGDTRFFDTDKLTAAGAPIVADYWEYRYHDKADALDALYSLSDSLNDHKQDGSGAADIVAADLKIDISNPNIVACPDSSYTGTYTQGMKDAYDALLNLYSNWERAVKWVWSTNQENVPSAGTYSEADVGEEVYVPNTYYILSIDENSSSYILDESLEYDNTKTYYKDMSGNKVVKLCASIDFKYLPNKFYVESGLGDYILDPDGIFNADITYYALTLDEENSGAKTLAEVEPEAVDPETGGIEYNGHLYLYDTKEYRNAKFVNDLTKHFNLEYLVTYFIMTEVFECYDSRGKNMMMASWGPQTEGGDYIWYPIFYDIDTQLGINNTGIPSFEYYIDATEDGSFSTNDSILFNNLYRNFKGTIIQKYRQLKGMTSQTYNTLAIAPLETIERIEKWYLADPSECKSLAMRGERPLIAFNLDEYYKYITITNREGGYHNRNGTISYDGGTYFYMLQGDRSLSRQQFLINRFNYIDSWLNQGQYERGGSNVIRGRISANRPSAQADKWIEGSNRNTEPTLIINENYWQDENETIKTHLFDGEYWVDMEPVRNSYVTMGTDAANFPSQKYTNTEGPVRFIAKDLENGIRTSGGYAEQLLYIYGIDQMKSLGDMSRLYWTELEFQSSAKKLTELLLGYDGLDENNNHYKNQRINTYSLKASNDITDDGGMPLLKKANLSYITFTDNTPTFDFSSAEKLTDFRAIGSNITGVTFATGVALNTLYLPDTITELNLTEATQLNNIVTTHRDRKDSEGIDVYPGLYIPNLTDAPSPQQATSRILTLKLIGDYLGYDSYKLLNNYYYARLNSEVSKITITGVDWSPYKQLTKGAEYSSVDAANNLYWVDNGHYSFDAYTGGDGDAWDLAIQNGELYRLDPSVDASQIQDTSLLTNLKTKTNFLSTATSDNQVPIISGIIYIDNDTAVNEKDIENEFGAAYPDLKFFFKTVNKVPAAKYVILNDDGTYDLLARRSLGDNESFFPNPSSIIDLNLLTHYDTRTPKYDFYGWSEKPLSPSDVSALNNELWYQRHDVNTGYDAETDWLVKTTTDTTVLPIEDQYDDWNKLSRVTNKYDYVFYAVYYIHKYAMHFIDGNGNEIETVYVPANAFIADPKYKPVAFPQKDDTALDLFNTYKHIGWASKPDGDPEEWTEANIGRANRNRTFYAVFEQADVRDNVLPDECFGIKSFTVMENNVQQTYYSVYPDVHDNPSIKSAFQGKITIPKKVIKNNVEYTVNGFSYYGANTNNISDDAILSQVTHVFFEPGTVIKSITSCAFMKWSNLRYVDLPNNGIEVEGHAFQDLPNMFRGFGENLQTYLNLFFEKIKSIGVFAFSGLGRIHEVNTPQEEDMYLKDYWIRLPNLQKITNQGFANMYVGGISFGSMNNHLNINRGTGCFFQGTSNQKATAFVYKDFVNYAPVPFDLIFYYQGDYNAIDNIVSIVYSNGNTPENYMIYDSENNIYAQTT